MTQREECATFTPQEAREMLALLERRGLQEAAIMVRLAQRLARIAALVPQELKKDFPTETAT